MLKAPAAMAASVAVQRGLHVGWKLVTGHEPPSAPDDKQVPLGQAVAWTALFGAAVAGARLIAGRYASAFLAPRRQRQGVPEPAPGQSDGQDRPLPQAEAPGLLSLILVAVLAWRRRR
jgi:MYXO-CTERM domain-containing protein